MKIRWKIYLSFVVVVAASSLLLCLRKGCDSRPEAVWLAETDLPVNTRVYTNYLKRSNCPTPINAWELRDPNDFAGKYVTRTNIPAGCEVDLSNLGPLPPLREPSDYVLLFYSASLLDANVAEAGLNSGTRLRIWPGNKPADTNTYTVEAVLGDQPKLILAIRVLKTNEETLRSITNPQLRLVSLK